MSASTARGLIPPSHLGHLPLVTFAQLLVGFALDARPAATAFYESLLVTGVALGATALALHTGMQGAALGAFVFYKLVKAAVWPAMAKGAKAVRYSFYLFAM